MLAVILFFGLVLRLISINQSLWLDEAINLWAVKNLSFKTLAINYPIGDFHPPLYHLILKVWVNIFGATEIAARSPSIVLGVLSIIIVFLITRKLFETKTALIASTLVATGPLHIYYSQEARMYMLASFLALLSIYFFISLLRNDKLIYWVGFVVSTVLLLYTDYLPYLLLPTFIAYLFLNKSHIKNSTFKTFFPSFILIGIFTAPWIYVFKNQLTSGLSLAAASPAWANVVGGSSLKDLALVFIKFNIGRISHTNDFAYFLMFAPVGFFSLLLLGISFFRASHFRIFLWFWLLIPVIAAFVISFVVPVFAYFRLIFLLPAFYILWASAINTVNYKPLTRTLLFLALTINLFTSGIYFLNPKFQREDWKSASNFVKANSTEKTVVLFLSSFIPPPFEYYNKGEVKALGALSTFSSVNVKPSESLDVLDNSKKVFLFQYLYQITDPDGLIFMEITKKGFTNTSTKDFQGIGFIYEFTK